MPIFADIWFWSGRLVVWNRGAFRPRAYARIRLTRMRRMEALQKEKAALHSALRRVREEMRGAQKRSRVDDPALSAGGAVLRCPATLATAEAVYHLSDRASAEEFFSLARRRKQQSASRKLPPEIWGQWASKSADEVAHILGTDANPSVAHRRAVAFLNERGLRDWVRDQNLAKACAPGGQAVRVEARRRGALRPPIDAHEPDSRPAACPGKKQHHWVRRWARRWNLRRGRFQASSRLLPAVAARKATGTRGVGQLVHETLCFVVLVSGPPGGPIFGTKKQCGV